MHITDQKLWQIGSGDNSRDYSKMCMDFGIAIVGPGSPGNAKEVPEKYEDENDWGIKLLQIKAGDVVLLRRGQKIIKAVGYVVKEYDYSFSLSDIHGWDLNHYITVDWYICRNEKDIELPYTTMIGYSTMSSINKHHDYIVELINSKDLVKYESKRKLSELKNPRKIATEDLNNHFIEHGIRIGDAMNISNTINKIITLVRWYKQYDPKVLEHELRSFMVIPFLFSLGWSEQKIKMEFNKVDIALFKKPYIKGRKTDPIVIIETKTFDDGLALAKKQILYYSENFRDCKIMVTTNGYRYCVYRKEKESFGLYSYFNLLDMREFDYIENTILGALEGIISISNY